MSNKAVIVIILSLLMGSTALWMASAGTTRSDNVDLPKSLDQYYGDDPIYLYKMYELGESMVGITVNLQHSDIPNATKSFEVFAQAYENSARMVPQWRGYYKPNKVKKLGDALYEPDPDIQGAYRSIEEISETCADCHYDTMPLVYDLYYGGDFRNVNIVTPEGILPWKKAKMVYLLSGFDGIGVYIKQDNQLAAAESFILFEMMFNNMSATCVNAECHSSQPRYYVSDDVQTLINYMGSNITDGNFGVAEGLRYEIGGHCHTCHIIHIPSHYAKLDGI